MRLFWAGQPESTRRPRLLQRLYPDITELTRTNPAFLAAFFGEGLTDTQAPGYSHAIRWHNNRRLQRFFSEELSRAAHAHGAAAAAPEYPPEFSSWDPLAQSQYLEITIFLSQYLLCSQGDRMAMAHSVEGRFPYLDHRLVEFCNRLPARLKLRGLKEKYLLKQLGRQWLPPSIWRRPKRPYRAPIHRSFFNAATPDYVRELLSPAQLQSTGLFKPAAVLQLVHKIEAGHPIGETDDMALAGILSTQLVHHHFVNKFSQPPPLSTQDEVKICRGPAAQP